MADEILSLTWSVKKNGTDVLKIQASSINKLRYNSLQRHLTRNFREMVKVKCFFKVFTTKILYFHFFPFDGKVVSASHSQYMLVKFKFSQRNLQVIKEKEIPSRKNKIMKIAYFIIGFTLCAFQLPFFYSSEEVKTSNRNRSCKVSSHFVPHAFQRVKVLLKLFPSGKRI